MRRRVGGGRGGERTLTVHDGERGEELVLANGRLGDHLRSRA